MSRTTISPDHEDTIFRIFEDAGGVQRRLFRMIARGFYNDHGIAEVRSQLEGMIAEVDDLAKIVAD